jgi:hypothetical protein
VLAEHPARLCLVFEQPSGVRILSGSEHLNQSINQSINQIAKDAPAKRRPKGIISIYNFDSISRQKDSDVLYGWGDWRLEGGRFLTYGPDPRSTVDLTLCTTSAVVLDWILQIVLRGHDIRGFMLALVDTLNPQKNLCPYCLFEGGRGKTIRDVAAILKKQNCH